ncbi:PREDICTED: uncharacterized protein LOC109129171 [Camelina sativa]|uniref:Uncharacterized protein LOC109129171 n=1 Tax=Camelina sativa TaxID=90675 RepID=A0ABM1R032_CAMSA|nr:PREDICTED: uncharacterized protein LOC109129171 [Camelina sativa]
MEVARSMMFHTNVPRRFWGDAVLAACYLINRIPTNILQDVSPFEVNYATNLRLKAPKQCSLDILLLKKGYYKKKNWEDLRDLPNPTSDRATNLRIILERLGVTNDRDAHHSPELNPPGESQPTIESSSREPQPQLDPTNHSNDEELNSHNLDDVDHPEETIDHEAEEDEAKEDDPEDNDHEEVIPLRRSQRLAVTPLRRSQRIASQHNRFDYNNMAVAYPIQAVRSLAHLPKDHQVFLGHIDKNWIPQTYDEAKEHKVWRDVVQDERMAMEKNHTWDEADLPKGKKAIRYI